MDAAVNLIHHQSPYGFLLSHNPHRWKRNQASIRIRWETARVKIWGCQYLLFLFKYSSYLTCHLLVGQTFREKGGSQRGRGGSQRNRSLSLALRYWFISYFSQERLRKWIDILEERSKLQKSTMKNVGDSSSWWVFPSLWYFIFPNVTKDDRWNKGAIWGRGSVCRIS